MIQIPFLALNQYQHIQKFKSVQADKLAEWHVATTAVEFEQIQLTQKDQAVVIGCIDCVGLSSR